MRVVIADDQAMVRSGFRLILESGGTECACCSEGIAEVRLGFSSPRNRTFDLPPFGTFGPVRPLDQVVSWLRQPARRQPQ